MMVGLPRRGGTQISRRTRLLAATAATLIVIGGLVSLWAASLLPASYTATDMGVMDVGEVLTAASSGADHAGHTGDGTGGNGRGADRGTPNDVTAFVERRPGPADVSVTLTARLERVTLAPDLSLTADTLNGATPGPTIRARQGDLVEVKLRNESVPDGTTLHWHGLDVPNAMDGVAGVTQDAVWVGQTYTYRFVADQVGTYWYHSHQVSHDQVLKGLLGAIVIIPSEGIAEKVDVTALSHTYAGRRTVNGRTGDTLAPAQAGSTARIRLINTDRAIMPAWVSGAPHQLVALDGTEVTHQPEFGIDRCWFQPGDARTLRWKSRQAGRPYASSSAERP